MSSYTLYGSIIEYGRHCHKPGGGIFFKKIFTLSPGGGCDKNVPIQLKISTAK
jgi:hypothetical protein